MSIGVSVVCELAVFVQTLKYADGTGARKSPTAYSSVRQTVQKLPDLLIS
jgi:hypothetical protein